MAILKKIFSYRNRVDEMFLSMQCPLQNLISIKYGGHTNGGGNTSFVSMQSIWNFNNNNYKWVGLIKAEDGKLYGIPNGETHVLEIDTTNDTISMWGNISNEEFKYTGGGLYNGKIYGFPRSMNSVLEIDPSSHTINTIPLAIEKSRDHHYSGIIAEGKLFSLPRFSNYVLVVDLASHKMRKIKMPRHYMYASAFRHSNGLIYCAPMGVKARVMVIEPHSEKIAFIGSKDKYNCFGLVEGENGCIYGYINAGGIIKIDPETNTVCKLHGDITRNSFYGSVLGPNGRMYSVIGKGDIIYEFNPNDESIRAVQIISEERGIAKCASACLSDNGSIYMIPAMGSNIYKLNFM